MKWAQWQGQQVLSLRDPLRLSAGSALVPHAITPLLALCDGTRDLAALRLGFLLRTGISLLPSQVEALIQALDEALLLDNHRFRSALQQALETYRSAPCRPLALAGEVYPEDVAQLLSTLDEYSQQATAPGENPRGRVVGVISPHIDFARGWRTYAKTWQMARSAVEEAELVILLGTDHGGSPGSLTLTRQSYATPWGTLPTDIELVDHLAGILGQDRAFAEEMHHIGEHSIELTTVWLHYIAGGKPKRLLPVLCGPHEPLLTSTDGDTARIWRALEFLAEKAAQPGTLVVAGGDLSHVGPTFGDPAPFDLAGKFHVRLSDEQWLTAVCSGDSNLLKHYILQHGDPTRICGAAPIHFMVSILQKAQGQVVAYEQCPADEEFGSLVSVAGVLFTA
jgi:AmmeMemoRadiSam system protein B